MLNIKEIKIFSGSSNKSLAKEIADYLKLPMGNIVLKTFADGEIYVRIDETVRGRDAFVVQSMCRPINNHIIELLIMIDALKRASAARITAVIPYYGYSRQDRKSMGREPITAKLVANMLTAAGADRVLTVDLHSDQIQGFFDIPLDHLSAVPILSDYIIGRRLKKLVVVSPDAGGTKRARRMAKILKVPMAILDKRRGEHNTVAEIRVIGNVKGRTAVIIDDIIDTGGTITEAISVLKQKGARDIYVCTTHPVFSDPASERMKKSDIKEVIITNTIPLPKKKMLKRIKVLSLAPLLGEAIRNIHEEGSVSALFDTRI